MPALRIYVEGSASDENAAACRERFGELVGAGWSNPVVFVDQYDDMGFTNPGDVAVLRTVGVHMDLPDPGSADSEAGVRRDVERLIAAVSELAGQAEIEFVVEYRQEEIGYLTGGPDDGRVVNMFMGS
jgi:hypothetical protein